jgi:hypothetical protein
MGTMLTNVNTAANKLAEATKFEVFSLKDTLGKPVQGKWKWQNTLFSWESEGSFDSLSEAWDAAALEAAVETIAYHDMSASDWSVTPLAKQLALAREAYDIHDIPMMRA